MLITSRVTDIWTAEALWSRLRFGLEKNGEWAIIHRCKVCGKFSSNRIAADDNPLKLMSIAVKPLAQPPFPVEYMEKLIEVKEE